MLHGRYVNAGNSSPIIRLQQATSDFKDSSEDPCRSQQDCSLQCCQLYPSVYVSQVVLQSLRNSTQYSYNNGDNFYTLHLPQLFNFNCQIKILVNLFLLFDVYPSVARACNVNDEAILVLFVHKHDVRAIVIQFLVSLYREIPK